MGAVVAVPGGDDLPVGLQSDGGGSIAARPHLRLREPERGRDLAIRAEAHVERAVLVVAGEGEVSTCSTAELLPGDDDLPRLLREERGVGCAPVEHRYG